MFGPILFSCWRGVQGADSNAMTAADDGKITCKPFAGLPESHPQCVGSLTITLMAGGSGCRWQCPTSCRCMTVTSHSSLLHWFCFPYYGISGGDFMVLMAMTHQPQTTFLHFRKFRNWPGRPLVCHNYVLFSSYFAPNQSKDSEKVKGRYLLTSRVPLNGR